VQQEEKWKTIRPARISAYFPETLLTFNYDCDLSQSVYSIDPEKGYKLLSG